MKNNTKRPVRLESLDTAELAQVSGGASAGVRRRSLDPLVPGGCFPTEPGSATPI